MDRSSKITAQVMDIVPDDRDLAVPLSSRCEPSDVQKSSLEPAKTATYTCRWIHITRKHGTFDQFTTTVDDLMRNYSDRERKHIQNGLRKWQRQNEVRGFHGPSFRPSFMSFHPEHQHQDSPSGSAESLDDHYTHGSLAGFLSMPYLSFDQLPGSWPFLFRKSKDNATKLSLNNYRPKSLLQYHYRFGKDLIADAVYPSTRPDVPVVHNTWCLVVDDRNLITVSEHPASHLWPLGRLETGISPLDGLQSLLMDLILEEYSFFSRIFNAAYYILNGSIIGPGLILLAVLFDAAAAFIPGGWIPMMLVKSAASRFLDVDVSFLHWLQVSSFLFDVGELTGGETKDLTTKTFDGFQDTRAAFLKLLGCRIGKQELQLASVNSKYLPSWREIDAKMKTQADPDEELSRALRSLWAIYIHFAANFMVLRDGTIYRFYYHGPVKRVFRMVGRGLIKLFRLVTKTNRKGVPGEAPHLPLDFSHILITHKPRKKGETLQDLENDFIRALAALEAKSHIIKTDMVSLSKHEDRVMLADIHRSRRVPAMACLWRICTITSPTRFLITARDISDMYARVTAQLDWLLRDSVTQSLVYQISAVEDELRIIKNIMHSQQDVIGQVAQRFVELMMAAEPRTPGLDNPYPDKGKATQLDTTNVVPIDNNSLPDIRALSSESSSIGVPKGPPLDYRHTLLLDSLKQKAHVKHDILMSEIQRHDDTVERLKTQAAMLINIKTEGQGVAIFIFTIVTIIFLPLSFVTSYLGMKTADIRDLESGQWLLWAIGGPLTVMVSIGGWLIARRGPKWKNARQAKKLRDVEDWKWGYRD